MRTKRTRELFAAIYDVLMKHAGAHIAWRTHFMDALQGWTEEDPYQTHEYRFGGTLGPGGKFWLGPESFHVSAYREDMAPDTGSPARRVVVQRTNEELKKLFVAPEEIEPEDKKEA